VKPVRRHPGHITIGELYVSAGHRPHHTFHQVLVFLSL
jgi:hypothetical protein